ncbi:MAG: PIN domain-containing protein [Defluviitaleaceae bacterium]|nr:PIN domain-containing protein [Defluviitaleaceae bacterium]
MRKLKLYLDTSIISHLHQLDAPDKMNDTLILWEHIKDSSYDVVLSSVGFYELGKCSAEKQVILAGFISQIRYQHIEVDDAILATAERFIDMGILTRRSYLDCQHIAAAIHAGCDLVVSWNFQHMVNVRTIRGAKIVTAIEGYKDILICSPNMLIEGGFEYE